MPMRRVAAAHGGRGCRCVRPLRLQPACADARGEATAKPLPPPAAGTLALRGADNHAPIRRPRRAAVVRVAHDEVAEAVVAPDALPVRQSRHIVRVAVVDGVDAACAMAVCERERGGGGCRTAGSADAVATSQLWGSQRNRCQASQASHATGLRSPVAMRQRHSPRPPTHKPCHPGHPRSCLAQPTHRPPPLHSARPTTHALPPRYRVRPRFRRRAITHRGRSLPCCCRRWSAGCLAPAAPAPTSSHRDRPTSAPPHARRRCPRAPCCE